MLLDLFARREGAMAKGKVLSRRYIAATTGETWICTRNCLGLLAKLELIAGAVWTSFFGPSKSANNFQFKVFQEKWKVIDKIAPIARLSE